MKIDDINIEEPFKGLYPKNPENLARILASMSSATGYDESHPVIVWKERKVLIDGHTRLEAWKGLGNDEIPASERSFESEDEAFTYAIHVQRDRRNLTNADKLHLVEVIDNRWQRGGDRKSDDAKSKAPNGAIERKHKKSADLTAETLHLSARVVERLRKIRDYGSEEIKECVRTGKYSIDRACRKISARPNAVVPREASPKRFNRNAGKIEWARWSLNVLWGCRRNCSFCFARSNAARMGKAQEFWDIQCYEERLVALETMKVPKKSDPAERMVFCGSMSDLFAPWIEESDKFRGVRDRLIDGVRAAWTRSPEWTFVFLTKFPENLTKINWPGNTWVGATAHNQKAADNAIEAFSQLSRSGNRPPITFASCEPLLEAITFRGKIDLFDWLIVGGQSACKGVEPLQPEWPWVESLLQEARTADPPLNLYFKPNLLIRPMEYPAAKPHLVGNAAAAPQGGAREAVK